MLSVKKELVYVSFAMALLDIYMVLPRLETPEKNIIILRLLFDLFYMSLVYNHNVYTRSATTLVAFPLSYYLLIRLFKT